MKNTIFLFTLLLLSYCSVSQTIIIRDSIKWIDNKTILNYKNESIIVLDFIGAFHRNSDYLPLYFRKENISASNININNISIIKSEYIALTDKDENILKHLKEVEDKIYVKAYNRINRKQSNISFEMIPIRKNPNTGNYELLTYFEVQISYSEKPGIKTSRSYTTNSKLNSGRWYKIKVANEGIYKLSYEELVEMGFANFSNIGVFGYGGELPKVISSNYIDDIPERPLLKVDANSDGVFNAGDYILFYADGPHKKVFSNNLAAFHEFHSYSDYAYYFVSDRGTWKQAQNYNPPSNHNTEVSKYDDYLFLEKDSLNLIKSGRQWYWKHFDYFLTHNFTITVPNISLTDTATVKVFLAARSSSPSYFSLTINGNAQQNINISNVSGGPTAIYARTNSLNTFSILPQSNNQSINLTYHKTSSNSEGWLDYISFECRRFLSLNNNYLQFRDTKSAGSGKIAKFNISNAGSSTIIWDITDRINYQKMQTDLSGNMISFIADATNIREYIAFNSGATFPSPIISNADNVGLIENQNLHALNPVDLIIVTHPAFYSQAQQIQTIHDTYDNYSSFIVTPQQIYNEFSSGTPDVSAIRNFVKMIYDKASGPNEIPRNLLLIGDGSYDNKSVDPSVSNFILTYQSQSSLAPTTSFVSDDFYVFLDDGEGGVTGNEDMDMGVGRFPVKSAAEAQVLVNKINTYYSTNAYGNWKNILCFIADDFDNNELVHQVDTEKLTAKLDAYHPVYNIDKIYLDDYQQISTVQGQRYPEVNQALNNRISNGALIINWVGHGNEKTWAHEMILTLSMIQNWNNSPKYPIFVTATCEFSPWDHHEYVSGGEMVLLNPNGGGVALLTTTRLAFASSNYRLLDKLYDHFFDKDAENKNLSIGEISARAKNDLPGDTNKRVFAVLGSSALRPSVPKYDVRTTKINGIDVNIFNDTINSQSLVSFEGAIFNQYGNIVENFNGVVNPTVYDKRMEYTTQANDGHGPLNYTAQKNILFNGQASVTNGRFSFSFVVPIDIAYFYDAGKVSYYAHNNTNLEAHGYDKSFIIGGSSDNPVFANQPPQIELYMNNEQFVHGGITDENPILLAKLFSDVGINTVGSGIGHDLTMTLNENTTEQVILNTFYESEIDDFTRGTVKYQLSQLPLGPHTLKLKAWDVLNNSAEAFTDFIVASSSELIIDHIFNYPNPFSTNTVFYFDHNQPNTQLDVLIQIFTLSGKHIKSIETTVVSDGYRSHPIPWNAKDEYNDKLAKGVYIYKIKVREPGGNTVEKFEKMVILN